MGRLAGSALVVLLLTVPLDAQTRSYSIESFRVVLQVTPEADLIVQETIAFAFKGSHQGIFRAIPVRYERHGFNYDLRVDAIEVLDEWGNPLRTEVSYPGRYVKIKAWVPGARDATRTATIYYRVRRALLSFEDHDELYWNATGNEWAAPIVAAEAIVELPGTIPGESVQTAAYTGPSGATGEDYTLERTENLAVFRTSRPLRAGEGLTVVVGWPSGHVRFPSRLQEAGWFLMDQRWFALPLVIFAACLLAWRSLGRDPLRSRSVKPEYEPPPGLRAGEVGTLVDETAHPRDVVATIVDLAVRGHLTIEEVKTAFDETDYLFKLTKPWLGDPDVAPFEVIVLAQVFGARGAASNVRLLSEVRKDSRATFPPIRDQLYRDLVEKRHFFASPHSVRRFWSVVGALFLVVPALLAYASLRGSLDWLALPHSFSMLLAFAACGLIVLAFARVMPRKTLRGAQARLHILGFQEFLERVEKDRLNRLPSDVLHKWLPHAIALGVEEAWISRFEGVTVEKPTWYESDRPFTLSGYSRQIRGFEREVETAWLAGRRGSFGSSAGGGGSGFSGGSSGGGFGGGGGGTF
jgi:uncharacterized membrane protein YgcG